MTSILRSSLDADAFSFGPPVCHELTHQLRVTAAQCQVEGARLALQHNLGLGGACVVTLYERV